MARGITLGLLVDKLRIAARYDPNPALSVNMGPLFRQTLQDTQERLWEQFDWPFLKVQRDIVLGAGQQFYDFPDDIDLERVVGVDVLNGGLWEPVERGITLDEYNACNSDLDARRDPVERWDVRDTGDGEQIELWPLPTSNGGKVRVTGIRKLRPLVEDSDRADIDDQLIVAFAAAELLWGRNDNEAQLKMNQGNSRLKLLQGRTTKKRNNGFVLGGGSRDDSCRGFARGVTVVATQPGS
jgi:hypothetical protein